MHEIRLSDIPAKVRIKNIDPSKTAMNVCGVIGVPYDGKVHEKNLDAFRPELRIKVWESLQTMHRSRLLNVETITDEAGAHPEALQPPPAPPGSIENDKTKHEIPNTSPVGDDFIKVGFSDVVQKRLYANGINTYQKFLDADANVLVKIEGIGEKELDGWAEKVFQAQQAPGKPEKTKAKK